MCLLKAKLTIPNIWDILLLTKIIFFQQRKNINIIRRQCFFPIPSVFFRMWNLSPSFHQTLTAPPPRRKVICEFGRGKCMDSSVPPSFLILGSGDTSLLLWEPILGTHWLWANTAIYSFIHSFKKFLLCIYNVLGPESTSVNIIVKIPNVMKFTF